MSRKHKSAKLRREVERMFNANIKKNSEIARLLYENAKLRLLVRSMWEYISTPVNQRNNLKERLATYDDLANRMRELGIEVDG